MPDSRQAIGTATVLEPTAEKAEVGSGLLGFSPKPLGRGDTAYLTALGLTEDQIQQVVADLRDGMSPLTRKAK